MKLYRAVVRGDGSVLLKYRRKWWPFWSYVCDGGFPLFDPVQRVVFRSLSEAAEYIEAEKRAEERLRERRTVVDFIDL